MITTLLFFLLKLFESLKLHLKCLLTHHLLCFWYISKKKYFLAKLSLLSYLIPKYASLKYSQLFDIYESGWGRLHMIIEGYDHKEETIRIFFSWQSSHFNAESTIHLLAVSFCICYQITTDSRLLAGCFNAGQFLLEVMVRLRDWTRTFNTLQVMTVH